MSIAVLFSKSVFSLWIIDISTIIALSEVNYHMVFLLVLFLIPWYLWSINCTGQDRWRKITLDASLQNIPYFDWDPSNKWDFYCWFTSASQWDVNWDPSHVNRDPYQKSHFLLGSRWDMVGYGGIPVRYGLGSRLDVYWDPGGIWWDMDWDPGWMCTGIPVGCVLGSQWDMDWDPSKCGLGSLPNIPVG